MGRMRPAYDLRACGLEDVRDLFEQFHGYKSVGKVAVYTFAVYEGARPVAAFVWNPPPPGAARSVCPEAPGGVLALSRMVAVDRDKRELNHISKPLRRQMKALIDRGRWPALVTYSDEGQGHTGHVYKCSGWEPTRRSKAPVFEDDGGRRRSRYCAGKIIAADLNPKGHTYIQRWEQWACDRGAAHEHMQSKGWRHVRVPARTWRSGNPCYTWVQEL